MIDATFVINLDSRPDRLQRFTAELPTDWPFSQPIRWRAATDLDAPRRPSWWQAVPGAWGCLQSHVQIWRAMLENCWQTCLILEDDAVFCDGFAAHATAFMSALPADWQQAYLGGEHYRQNIGLPVQVSEHVLRAWNVNRTHAYVIRDEFAEEAIAWVTAKKLPLHHGDKQHIDHRLGYLHERRQGHGIYAPRRWLVGQDAGASDIARNGRVMMTRGKPDFFQHFRLWRDAEKVLA
jgi:hypothetical protein